MTKEVYKVVKNLDGILISAIVRDPIWKVEYTPNKWATPLIKNSKLTCFDTLNNAQAFIKSCWDTGFEIWEAEAMEVEYAQFLGEYLLPNHFNKFWDNLDNLLLWSERNLQPPPSLLLNVIEAPKGTLYTGKLKLIKKVIILNHDRNLENIYKTS